MLLPLTEKISFTSVVVGVSDGILGFSFLLNGGLYFPSPGVTGVRCHAGLVSS